MKSFLNRLDDLRFVIGLFFMIIALILIGTGMSYHTQVNLGVGVFMGAFSGLMLLMSRR